jgi:hypothetical protein
MVQLQVMPHENFRDRWWMRFRLCWFDLTEFWPLKSCHFKSFWEQSTLLFCDWMKSVHGSPIIQSTKSLRESPSLGKLVQLLPSSDLLFDSKSGLREPLNFDRVILGVGILVTYWPFWCCSCSNSASAAGALSGRSSKNGVCGICLIWFMSRDSGELDHIT